MNHAGWDADVASDIIGEHAATPGALLPMLHAIQKRFGFVPEAAIPMAAQALNLGRAEVHGVASFYRDFRSRPPGRHVLKLCRAEACQATGGLALADQLLDALGVGWGETTPDGRLTVELSYCLGLCASAPAALLDEHPVGRLTSDRLARMVEACSP